MFVVPARIPLSQQDDTRYAWAPQTRICARIARTTPQRPSAARARPVIAVNARVRSLAVVRPKTPRYGIHRRLVTRYASPGARWVLMVAPYIYIPKIKNRNGVMMMRALLWLPGRPAVGSHTYTHVYTQTEQQNKNASRRLIYRASRSAIMRFDRSNENI